jgi:transcriptional regulator with XRE-family HTH domain
MPENNRIENRIWKYRTLKGLKQEDLAFLLGHKTSGQISRYERGLVMPKLEQTTKICFGLETKIKSLYPEQIKKWREEVDIRKGKLKKIKK